MRIGLTCISSFTLHGPLRAALSEKWRLFSEDGNNLDEITNMPMTGTDVPVLSQFLCSVSKSTGMPVLPLKEGDESGETAQSKPLPKGVVLGPDGKPCRSCTSAASWQAMLKDASKKSAASAPAAKTPPALTTNSANDCPPDAEQLGRSSWTLLHAITATYPTAPSQELQKDTRQFISSFSKLYPCWTCASDFQQWLKEDGNAPRVSSRDEFGRWMCEAHNAVNVKLGKQNFDCNRWEERWRTGWKDGRCG